MIRRNKRNLLISSIIILLPMAAGLMLWSRLPQRLPTHWNVQGVVDGWSGKGFAVFGIPLFLLAMHWLCVAITAADPKSTGQSRKAMGLVIGVCPLISVLVGAITYTTALGMEVRVERVVPLVIGLMIAVIGNYLPKCKQNYTMGIKVPWTLADEGNWDATHRFGGKVWVIGGVAIALCAFLPRAVLFPVFLVLLTVMVFLPILYSYLYYRKHK